MSLRLRLGSDIAEMAGGQRQMRDFLESAGASERAIYFAELVYDELVTNVIKYAYGGKGGQRPIDVGISIEADNVVVTVEDDGPPFNPLQAAEPAHPTTLEEATPGGLGISLVKMAAAQVDYERRDECNRVRVAIPKT